MSKNQQIVSSGSLGGIFLTITGLDDYINKNFLPVPDIIYKVLFIVGVICLMIALFHGIIKFAGYLKDKYYNTTPIYTYDVKIASNNEFPKIHEFCCKIIPGAFATIKMWYDRYKTNQNIIYIIERETLRKNKKIIELKGGFSIFPLKKAATDNIENGIIKGIDLLPDDLSKTEASATSIYIAWIVSTQKGKDRAATLSYLKNYLKKRIEQNRNIVIYTKPTTQDGLRLVKKYNFLPLDGGEFTLDKIYKINGNSTRI